MGEVASNQAEGCLQYLVAYRETATQGRAGEWGLNLTWNRNRLGNCKSKYFFNIRQDLWHILN